MNAPQFNGPDDRQDACLDDWRLCECAACRAYRDRVETNAEGPAFDDALGMRSAAQQCVEAARRVK